MNQFFSPLAEPVGAVWMLMALGVVWLLWRRQWRSAMWLGFPTVLLFVLGSTSVAEKLVAAEEKQWVHGEKAESGKQKAESVNREEESGKRPGEVNGVGRTSRAREIGNDSQLSTLNSAATGPGETTPHPTLSPNEAERASADGASASALNSLHPSAFILQPSAVASPADAVVALGGGQRVSDDDLLGFAMEGGGSRVLTAIELVRSGKARTLVLGGSWPMPALRDVPSMCVVQDWLTAWGLAGGAVTNLGICLNTHEEAVAFKKLSQSQGWQKVMLVTSALHMRRSVALFRKQGIEITPVAADFQVQGVSQDLPFSPFPREHRFSLLTLYMHEKIGWWVYRLRGWV